MSNIQEYKNPRLALFWKLKKLQEGEYAALNRLLNLLDVLRLKINDKERMERMKITEISKVMRDIAYVLNTLENTRYLVKRFQLLLEETEETYNSEGIIEKKIIKKAEVENPEIIDNLISEYNDLMLKINKKWHKE